MDDSAEKERAKNLFVYANDKAGMGQRRDKAEVARIIHKMSKGSSYYEQQVKEKVICSNGGSFRLVGRVPPLLCCLLVFAHRHISISLLCLPH